jgi:hypothetical protein
MIPLVRAAVCALYPRTGELPGVGDCDLDAFLRRFRREAPLFLRLGVLLGALVFQATPLFTIGVPLPAFLVPRGMRDLHAERIAATRFYLVRQLIFLLKLVGGLCWGAHPEVRKRFALPPLPGDPDRWRVA